MTNHFGGASCAYASRLWWYPTSASPWSSSTGTSWCTYVPDGNASCTPAITTAAWMRPSLQHVCEMSPYTVIPPSDMPAAPTSSGSMPSVSARSSSSSSTKRASAAWTTHLGASALPRASFFVFGNVGAATT